MGVHVKALLDTIRQATGAMELSDDLSEVDIVNDAGEYLCTMHAWCWLERPEATIDFVADQDWAALPADLRDITNIVYADSLTNSFRWVDASTLTLLRQRTIERLSWKYSGAIERISTSGGISTPRLALYPTPSTALTAAMTIRYRAGWTQVGRDANLDTAETIIPNEFGALFKRMCRIFALAIEEEEEASLEERLELLEQSSFLDRYKEADGAMQPELGVLEGGAVQSEGHIFINYDSEEGLALPS